MRRAGSVAESRLNTTLVWTTGLLLVGLLGARAFPQAGAPRLGGLTPARLRCEYLVNPAGIGERRPRLSWVLVPSDPARRGQFQTAYQILASGSAEELALDRGGLWDTGRVASSDTAHIEYAGEPLRARQRVYWKVRVWDESDRASEWSDAARFSMGLLDAGDWGAARWIGDPTPPPAVVAARNGYHSELGPDPGAARWVAVALGEPAAIDAVRLHPARPYDWPDTPGLMFPLRFRVEAGQRADFGDATTVVDRTAEDVANPGTEPLELAFPAVRARHVRLLVSRTRARDPGNYAFALAELEVLSGGRNVARGAVVTAQDSIETGAWARANLTDGDLRSHGALGYEPLPAPLLRTTFEASAPGGVRRATAFVTALGLYELRINGKRVGDRALAPEWTDYRKRVQVQSYDVTSWVRSGDNAIGVILGDGWYAGKIGLAGVVPGGPPRAIYGRQPRLLLRLDVELADGTTKTVVSDGTWRSTLEGPIRAGDLLDGEHYDARRELPGWDEPGFDDGTWAPVAAVEVPGVALVSQPNEPIRVTGEIAPVSVTEPRPDTYVFDLGQNFAGWCRLRVRGRGGTTVTLRHAEVLNPDGTIYTANLRGAAATDRYTLRGDGEEVFEPRFTYHGFRYVEATGLGRGPEPGDLVGRVAHSAARETAGFECSDAMLNRLWSNILWTQRANLYSTPTDCPQRDERLGWMGDILAFAPTACVNMDMAAFLTKWMQDVRDAQADDGRFADFSPHPFDPNVRFAGAPAWGDAGVLVPWTAYLHYGDRRLLERQYAAAVRWVELVRGRNPDLLWKHGRGNDYGDWLNADTLRLEGWPRSGAEVPKEVFATAFFQRSVAIVARIADVLGRREESERYAALAGAIRTAFQRAYVRDDGTMAGDTQAGYALALHFGLVPESLEAAAAARMVQRFEPYGGQISTGFHTTAPLMLELSGRGYVAEAYRLALNRRMPSWGYAIEQGATTIWERWDGFVAGRGFQDPGMNSLAHYAIGAVGEWMFSTVLGIAPDPAAPGFASVRIAPRPGPGVTWCRGWHESQRGRIACAWSMEDGRLRVRVEIPPNVTATVSIPRSAGAEVTEGGVRAADAEGVRAIQESETLATFGVASGRYEFEAAWGGAVHPGGG